MDHLLISRFKSPLSQAVAPAPRGGEGNSSAQGRLGPPPILLIIIITLITESWTCLPCHPDHLYAQVIRLLVHGLSGEGWLNFIGGWGNEEDINRMFVCF